ncbi:MAG: hypothetical protein KF819_22545 [Labilithrix sp.]|nr:hypothetical protein [Labilithrix sp.]
MSMRPGDTTPEAWAIMEEGIRKMSPAARVRRSIDLTILAHRFALARLRQLHPDDDERTLRLRLAARYIDPAILRRAFGFQA